jgi:hypothetical protein
MNWRTAKRTAAFFAVTLTAQTTHAEQVTITGPAIIIVPGNQPWYGMNDMELVHCWQMADGRCTLAHEKMAACRAKYPNETFETKPELRQSYLGKDNCDERE